MRRVDTQILTKEDIERPRSPDEFVIWVDKKYKELESPAMRESIRSRSGLIKKFVEEILPLKLFVKKEFQGRSDIQVLPKLDKQNFDAEIVDVCHTLRVEITYAKDGYDESLRFEVLPKERFVSFYASIARVSGRRGSPDSSIEIGQDTMVCRDRTVKEYLNLLQKRIAKKANRCYGPNCILLVAVDDSVVFRKSCDLEMLDRLVYEELLKLSLDFQRMVLIGISGVLYRSYDIKN